MASVAPAPRQEERGGAWNLLENAACFVFALKDSTAVAAWDEDGETCALSQGTDGGLQHGGGRGDWPLRRGGEEGGDDGSSPARSESYVTRKGRTTRATSCPRLHCSKSESTTTSSAGGYLSASPWLWCPCAASPLQRPAQRRGGLTRSWRGYGGNSGWGSTVGRGP